jgi:hypothetical protein
MNAIRTLSAFVLFIITIFLLLASGYGSFFHDEAVERIFSLLFLITFTFLTPPLFASYIAETREPFMDRGIFFIIHIPILILMYFFPSFASMIYILWWLLFSMKLVPQYKLSLCITLILFVLFFSTEFYISTYLLGRANILKLYTKFVLSGYVSVLCVSGLMIFRNKVVKTLGPLFLIGAGQLFIVLFDIICIVV